MLVAMLGVISRLLRGVKASPTGVHGVARVVLFPTVLYFATQCYQMLEELERSIFFWGGGGRQQFLTHSRQFFSLWAVRAQAQGSVKP